MSKKQPRIKTDNERILNLESNVRVLKNLVNTLLEKQKPSMLDVSK